MNSFSFLNFFEAFLHLNFLLLILCAVFLFVCLLRIPSVFVLRLLFFRVHVFLARSYPFIAFPFALVVPAPEGGGSLGLMVLFLEMLEEQLQNNTNFEVVHAHLGLFIKVNDEHCEN